MTREWEKLVTPEQDELYDAMSDVSEEAYFAGWMSGNEDFLWPLIHNGGEYGIQAFDRGSEQLERIRRAALAADCWIRWDAEHGPVPVPLAEWRDSHREQVPFPALGEG